MKISSSAFKENDTIPKKFTKDDANVSPPLHIDDIPSRAKSLALVVEDPDAPSGTFHHWVLFNMSPRTADIHENSVPVMATQGRNDFGELEYGGPKPPSGEHHYFFNVYALDTVLSLPRGTDSKALETEMKGHVVDQASLMGRYAHP
ncbi:MAG TPA: YbhB/YbcL family Raf kinase inhibitor-like protein [Verrucomicrobiae bacterium]|nr:YbhB/YbcL family Raf kinase inhibitor-like protein [Verrucomicrobiae bacterium]